MCEQVWPVSWVVDGEAEAVWKTGRPVGPNVRQTMAKLLARTGEIITAKTIHDDGKSVW